ncbi:MAG: divergent PAP2 family protein [Bacillota bacterium]
MKSFVQQLSRNHILNVAVLSGLVAQVLKVIIVILTTKKLDMKRLTGSGGMPSSHTAFVVALSTAVGRDSGWDSPLFALAVVFAAIVMYDAAGVRRAAGEQAAILNVIIEDFRDRHQFKQERLKELIGHTPFEVLAGAILGVFIAIRF